MDVYVGPRTGRRVFEGQIERGSFERIEAALWFADLRGFTQLSETTPVEEVISHLNGWLEPMVKIISDHGGEVLKFLGDGVLAIFPVSCARPPEQACNDALAAATTFSTGQAGSAGGSATTHHALALHYGEVAYGNIGAPHRLDFTVIGPAVNRTSRLQEIAKELGRQVVTSSAFARHLSQPLEDLGLQRLRSLAEPERVFGLLACRNAGPARPKESSSAESSLAIRSWGKVCRIDPERVWLFSLLRVKGIYRAPDAAAGEKALAAFEAGKWGSKYPSIAQSWRRVWGEVVPFYAFSDDVRRIVYTTNVIEALNAKLRRAVRARGHFPHDDAAAKLLYLVLMQEEKGWRMPPREWQKAKAQFAILFGERFARAMA
jgi:class 3 adenylate cyclase